jgi:surfeit locus 1 family protein
MFQRKWLCATLLVFAGAALCIRLGIWQLDRLESRRAFNTQVQASWSQPMLDLNQEQPDNIAEMEWRAVTVTGEYDFANQVALRNRYHGNEYGYHLLTPLHFAGKAVLVDRGWIPADDNSASALPDRAWRKYDEVGVVTLAGQIRLGQTKPAFGGVADPLPENGAKLEVWNNLDIARITGQMPYPILPVYIQLAPVETDIEPPIPFQPKLELTEGSHFGYALQWFTFATILFIGYPFYLQKQEKDSK